MSAVPDASSLIILGKIERVDLLGKLYGQILVTPWVWEEAVAKGRAVGAQDAAYLQRVARKLPLSKIKLVNAEKALAQRLGRQPGMGLGESEVLAVAKTRGTLAVLDDKDARAVAIGLDVSQIGTLGVLYEAFIKGLVSYQELLELVEKVGRVAWISPDLLATIVRRAREVRAT